LILDNRINAGYIQQIEVEVVISYTTPLGVTSIWAPRSPARCSRFWPSSGRTAPSWRSTPCARVRSTADCSPGS